jgi:hypothetical protein
MVRICAWVYSPEAVASGGAGAALALALRGVVVVKGSASGW